MNGKLFLIALTVFLVSATIVYAEVGFSEEESSETTTTTSSETTTSTTTTTTTTTTWIEKTTRYVGDYMVESWNHTTKEHLSGLVISDINGDGILEVLASASSEGAVYAFDWKGELLWKYNAPGYLFDLYADDVDGDGLAETLTGTTKHVYVIDGEGKLEWKYYTGADMVQALRTADVDSDGRADLLVGAASGGCRGNTLYVVNGSGKDVWRPYDLDRYYPSALTSFKSKDGVRVVVGLMFVARQSASGECLPSRERGSRVVALDGGGNMVWMFNTSGGVTSVHASDLDGDGGFEVMVGAYPDFYLLDEGGRLLWNYTTVTRVDSLASGDLNGDGRMEVVVGSDDVYVFDLNGSLLWESDLNTRFYVLFAGDLDGDGSDDVVGGSDRIYVFGGDGGLKWKSESFVSFYLLAGGDLEGDGYIDVVGGAGDKILAFKTTSHVKLIEANTYYASAKNQYTKGEFMKALEYAERARDLYSGVGEEDEASKTLSLIKLIKERLDYIKSIRVEADTYLNMSRDSYALTDFYNATRYARIAKAKYLSPEVDDRKQAVECDTVINKSLKMLSISVQELTTKAGEDYIDGNYVDALIYAKEARKIYELMNDEENKNKMDGMVSEIEEKTRRPIIDARIGFLGNQSVLEYSEAKIRSMKPGDVGFVVVAFIFLIFLATFFVSSARKVFRFLRRKKLDVKKLDVPVKTLESER